MVTIDILARASNLIKTAHQLSKEIKKCYAHTTSTLDLYRSDSFQTRGALLLHFILGVLPPINVLAKHADCKTFGIERTILVMQ